MTIEETIGKRVSDKRTQLGMTGEKFGTAIAEYLGKPWSRQTVSGAESGNRDWRAVDLVAAAQVLGVSVGYLTMPLSLSDEIGFPSGKSVPASDMRAFTITTDTPPIDAVYDSFLAMKLHLDAVMESAAAAQRIGEVVDVMFVRQEAKG